MAYKKGEIKFEIVKELCVLEESDDGHTRIEANIVSWNGGKPKFEVRPWYNDRETCGKMTGLTYEQTQTLIEYLRENEVDF